MDDREYYKDFVDKYPDNPIAQKWQELLDKDEKLGVEPDADTYFLSAIAIMMLASPAQVSEWQNWMSTMRVVRNVNGALFSLGKVYTTQGVNRLVRDEGLDTQPYLGRHVRGDWSEMSAEDQRENTIAVKRGDLRVFSAYSANTMRGQHKIWIITEADRSVTTILLPEEY